MGESFHSELQEKEADVREAETCAKELAEQLQRETTQKEELQSLLERLDFSLYIIQIIK